ncbi:hypothetical protein PRIPAC_97044 [Pristionchus pacificus]|uniref:Uncharacterized protein n=1 Tax=Pristionchus pacificus TaxID=54126 RepID=A0A2A6CUK3_PRIPA|nr:hypothetical protein PRIPAC_97044 [Pristionchus pacificus]|eukprot:PDM81798.1 hypothetical protein PRIPAC_33952 [Pristionchus pacificus]
MMLYLIPPPPLSPRVDGLELKEEDKEMIQPQGEKKSDSPDGERRGRGKKKEWKGVVTDDSDRSLYSQRDGKSPVKIRFSTVDDYWFIAKKASLAMDFVFGNEDSSSDSSSNKSSKSSFPSSSSIPLSDQLDQPVRTKRILLRRDSLSVWKN